MEMSCYWKYDMVCMVLQPMLLTLLNLPLSMAEGMNMLCCINTTGHADEA